MLTKRNRDPFAMFRQLTGEFDRLFGDPNFLELRWPRLRARDLPELTSWMPRVDVFEKDSHLVTRVDLPGLKKEDVKVDVEDGYLVISGERKHETEEKQQQFYRAERDYGSFYRAVPLPEGIKLDDVKARFTDGVLEVTVPLPVRAEPKPRRVEIEDVPKVAKTAA